MINIRAIIRAMQFHSINAHYINYRTIIIDNKPIIIEGNTLITETGRYQFDSARGMIGAIMGAGMLPNSNDLANSIVRKFDSIEVINRQCGITC